jgi:hypothetical protein
MPVLRPTTVLLAALALAAAPVPAQVARPTPTPALLAAITARGRAMARFERAAASASRSLLSTRPDTARVRQYVVRPTAAGWSVHFGRLSAARDTFYEAYVVTPAAGDSAVTIQQREPGRVGAEVDRAAAAAALLAQDAFGPPTRPYNSFVIPAERGEWWVYLLPAQTEPELYPHGGDVRYRVSADGRRILATRRMHADVVDVRMAAGETGHAHGPALDEVPEDSDVYFVLTRRPRAPELIETTLYDYRVEVDGSIRYVRHLKAGTAGDRAGRG